MSNTYQDKLKALLKQSEGPFERQPGCPDDYLLASYMEGGLSEQDHGRFETHLADCAYCLDRVGALARAAESPAVGAGTETIRKRSQWNPLSPRVTRWATAALLVMAVGIIVSRQSPSPVTSTPGASDPKNTVSERFIDKTSPIPEILSPAEGGLVDPQSFVFRWKEVPGSLFYDIRIVSDDGAQVVRQRVWDTQWLLPDEIGLQPGAEYFVRIDAYVSEGKAVSSEHTVFKAGNK